MVCRRYAEALSGCSHVVIPFCGGLSVTALLAETAREIVCNDKHRLAMNFYGCLADRTLRHELTERLNQTPFHQELLETAQRFCKAHTQHHWTDVNAAAHYFVTAWMGRSGKAGTDSEFTGNLAIRWDASGGASPLRFQTAVRSISEVWGPICERCSFLCCDWSDVLAKVKDDPRNGIYCDPPWVTVGDAYVHKFEIADHYSLATTLRGFRQTKVVLRYGDDPLVRQLYAEGDQWGWHIHEITSRDQANGDVSELCITNF